MSDQLETTDPQVEQDVITEESQDAKETTAAETDWKSEARKWEKRAKDANVDREDASKWREYEASLKPAQERMAEELAATKAEAESARATLIRYEVASEKGIPADALRLLTGSTREELEESADVLLALIATQSKTKTLVPDVNQGRPASDKVGQLTAADLEGMTPTEVNEARKAGRLNDVLGIH